MLFTAPKNLQPQIDATTARAKSNLRFANIEEYCQHGNCQDVYDEVYPVPVHSKWPPIGASEEYLQPKVNVYVRWVPLSPSDLEAWWCRGYRVWWW